MKIQSAKAKGRRLQQQIASDILNAFPALEDDDVRSTSMGAHGEDVQLSPRARDIFPYSIEAKNQERLNIWSAIEQAKTNCKGLNPLVIFHKNHETTYVALPWKHFLSFFTLDVPKVDSETKPEPESEPDQECKEFYINQLKNMIKFLES